MSVISQGLRGEMRFPSIHKMAGFTIEESATVPVRRKRWVPMPDKDAQRAGRDDRQMQGMDAPGRAIAAEQTGPLASRRNLSELIEV
jgi:hypothetical protein